MRRTRGRILKRPAHLTDFVLDDDQEPLEKSPRIQSQEPGQSSGQNPMTDENMEQKITHLMTMMASMNTTISSTIQTSIDSKMTPLHTDMVALKSSIESTSKQMEAMQTSVNNNIGAVQADIVNVRDNVSSLTTRVDNLQKEIDTGLQNHPRLPTPSIEQCNVIQSPSGILSDNSSSINRFREQKMIDLPKFDGDTKNWPNFIAEFNDTTRSEGYTTVQNNSRLKKCLSGKARDVVDSMLIHHENVPEVIERLTARFGRPEKIIKSQLDLVKAVAPISDNRIELLVQFADKVNNMRNVLKSCNSEHHLANPTLLEELVLKLPLSKRWTWAEHQSGIKPYATIEHFCLWLNKIADLADLIPTAAAASHPRTSNDKDKKDRGSVLLVSTEDDKVPSCHVTTCSNSNNHKTFDCPAYVSMDVDRRWELVTKEKLCFQCLEKRYQKGKRHPSWRCRKKSCGFEGCKGHHHISLHKTATHSLNANAPEFSAPTNQITGTEECYMNIQEDTEAKVFFKIVPVNVYGPLGSRRTFALLDEGSTITLMNRDLADDIGLKGESRPISIKGIHKEARQIQAEVTDTKIS